MKLLVMSNMYPKFVGDNYGVFVYNFVQSMQDRGVHIDLVAVHGRKSNFISKIIAYTKYIFMSWMLILRKKNRDLIYIHYGLHSLIPLVVLPKFILGKYVINFHGDDVLGNNYLKIFLRLITLRIVKNASLIVSPSNYFAEIIHNKYFVNRNKIFISYSGGVDVRDDVDHMNFTQRPYDVGFISRIDDNKGWDVFVEAVKYVADYKPTIKGYMAGGGRRIRDARNLISINQLDGVIDFFGSCSNSRVYELCRRTKIFVFSTLLDESLGLVGLEAMASGCVVVGSIKGALPEYILHEVNGYLFEAGNSDKLGKLILEILNSDDAQISKILGDSSKRIKKFSKVEVNNAMYTKLKEVIYGH